MFFNIAFLITNFYHSTKQAVESFSECMAYELAGFNISVATVQFGNATTSFQKNIAKCEVTDICSYNNLMNKITELLEKKSGKNCDLPQQIIEKLGGYAGVDSTVGQGSCFYFTLPVVSTPETKE